MNKRNECLDKLKMQLDISKIQGILSKNQAGNI